MSQASTFLEGMTPEEFERRVAHIHRVLSERGSKVTWNDRISDPDTPEQMRQVDVSIVDEHGMTIVECRHRKRPQDVQWVEELYGRKQSLNAAQVIGVSSSGFTQPALKKAERLGVFLRTLTEVSDREVQAWGTRARVIFTYIEMSDIKLYLVGSDRITMPADSRAALDALRKSDGSDWPLDDLISRVARWMLDTGLHQGPMVCSIEKPVDMFLGSAPIKEVLFRYNWRTVEREQVMPALLQYSGPESVLGRMESSSHSQTSIVQAPEGASVLVDVSVRSFVPCGILARVNVEFGQPIQIKEIGFLASNDSPSVEAMIFEVVVIKSHSRIYRFLKSMTRQAGHSASVPARYPEGIIQRH